MKLKIKFPRFTFRTITSIFFLMVVAVEIALTANYLYKNLKPETPPISLEKIIRADLKGYSQVYKDLNDRSIYEPQKLDYQNPNPFQYKE